MTTRENKEKLPPWIRIRIQNTGDKDKVASIINKNGLHTVCSSAKCPNLSECWHRGTATFMILGNYCSRNCRFCAVKHSDSPPAPNIDEVAKIANAIKKLKLKHAVITSVTRDDLTDGGATLFAETSRAIKQISPNTKIELLIPDLMGNIEALKIIINSNPDIINHNIETVRRLTPLIRSRANYERSLKILSETYRISNGKIIVKSGIMLGLGEKKDEIAKTIRDIRKTGASMLTIGQYLRPSLENIPIARYAEPNEFNDWKIFALELGFKSVWSGPLVRSSYMAEEQNCKSQ